MRFNVLMTGLFVLCAVLGVFSAPLGIQYHEPKTEEEGENFKRIRAARAEANRQILKMETALNDPTDAKHKPLIDAAFGTDPSLDLRRKKPTHPCY